MAIRYPRGRERTYELVPWDRLLTKGEVMEKYDKADSTITRLIKQGVLREGIDCFRAGNNWIFDTKRLDFIFNEPKEDVLKREKELNKKLKEVPDIDKYSKEQKARIKFVLEDGSDLKPILNPDYKVSEMKEIIIGLLHNIDVSVYAKPCFDAIQMEFIRKGLEDGLDVSLYANPEISSNKMYHLYSIARKGVDIAEFCKEEYDSWVLSSYHFYIGLGYPIDKYADPKYNYDMVSFVGFILMNDGDPSKLKGVYLEKQDISRLDALRKDYNEFDKELDLILEKYR